jgi:putative Ca2+/H+ antiporter (TMEM165/GDT1 family)
MQALLVSTLVVAVAEIGDRTQLLSLLLASRFKQPGPILLSGARLF